MDKKRKSLRLADYDYSSEGYYFITICCKDRENYFGTISSGKMMLSEIGKKASDFWQEIPSHFYHVKLDAFIIMPNHIHGIIIIKYPGKGACHGMTPQQSPNENPAGTCHGMCLRHGMTPNRNKINQFSKPIGGSVSVIINQYKASLKRWCNKNGYPLFQWQSRFYDNIITDWNSIDKIRNYIELNPRNWHGK